jgi:uncharacterized membrane protein
MFALAYGLGALLAIAGGALSFYFHAVYQGWLQPVQRWVPVFCRMDSLQCRSIVDTPYGRLAGYPNSFYGMLFYPLYVLLLVLAALRWIAPLIPLLAGAFTILVGIYLIYALIKLRVACPVCISVHSLNLFIFLLQAWGLFYY